jgi:hypothetical protein
MICHRYCLQLEANRLQMVSWRQIDSKWDTDLYPNWTQAASEWRGCSELDASLCPIRACLSPGWTQNASCSHAREIGGSVRPMRTQNLVSWLDTSMLLADRDRSSPTGRHFLPPSWIILRPEQSSGGCAQSGREYFCSVGTPSLGPLVRADTPRSKAALSLFLHANCVRHHCSAAWRDRSAAGYSELLRPLP